MGFALANNLGWSAAAESKADVLKLLDAMSWAFNQAD